MNEQVTRSSANVGFRTPLDCFTLFNGSADTSFRKIVAESGKFSPASGNRTSIEQHHHANHR
ncbi:hypothetical protein RF663_02090 [Aeromonas veronii]|uniref:hypothetical protein n=1 Tax=Aeromonas veronii TaxID=654 RepID=UPI0028534AB4|nr:hypothetical protein [Aeromonas veronii]MDR5013035.1 hypothetical protein [Aeromonas veronii]